MVYAALILQTAGQISQTYLPVTRVIVPLTEC